MLVRKLFVPALIIGLILANHAFAPSAEPDKAEGKMPPWEIAKAKVEAARKACQALAQEFLEGKATVEQVNQWSRRWERAQRDISNKKSNQLEALEEHVTRMRQLEKAAKTRLESSRVQASEVYAAEYHRLEAELELSKLKTSK